MASSKQEVVSLLTEHFRYTPLTLIDDIINTVNELVYRAVTAVEEGLTSTPPSNLGFAKARVASTSNAEPAADTSVLSQSELDDNGESLYPEKRVEVENGVHQLETLLESSVDKNFDKLEIYLLRNVFDVRGCERWVRLGHYQDLDLTPHLTKSPQDADTAATASSLLHLRRKLHATRQLNQALSLESRRNAALLTSLRSVLSPPSSTADLSSPHHTTGQKSQPNLSFLRHSSALQSLASTLPPLAEDSKGSTRHQSRCSVQTMMPLTDSTRALVSRLPELRATLAKLREAQAAGITAPTSRGARALERDAYIEGAVRAAGVGSGGGGGFVGRGGETTVGKQEMQDIEGIARSLGR